MIGATDNGTICTCILALAEEGGGEGALAARRACMARAWLCRIYGMEWREASGNGKLSMEAAIITHHI